jgi:hypothetical protein
MTGGGHRQRIHPSEDGEKILPARGPAEDPVSVLSFLELHEEGFKILEASLVTRPDQF